jgi:hypothetical protein
MEVILAANSGPRRRLESVLIGSNSDIRRQLGPDDSSTHPSTFGTVGDSDGMVSMIFVWLCAFLALVRFYLFLNLANV